MTKLGEFNFYIRSLDLTILYFRIGLFSKGCLVKMSTWSDVLLDRSASWRLHLKDGFISAVLHLNWKSINLTLSTWNQNCRQQLSFRFLFKMFDASRLPIKNILIFQNICYLIREYVHHIHKCRWCTLDYIAIVSCVTLNLIETRMHLSNCIDINYGSIFLNHLGNATIKST